MILPQYFFNRTTSVESWVCLHFKNTWSFCRNNGRNHISHHVFYVPESVCLGWRSFVGMWGKNVLDPSILKRVWSSEYDQPHNSHDHCHIVLEDNRISSRRLSRVAVSENTPALSLLMVQSERLKCCYYDSVKAQQFSLVNGQLGRWVGSLSGCSAWRSVENYTCVNEPNSL